MLLNINMGALELSRVVIYEQSSENMMDAYHAHALLHELAVVFSKITEAQTRVYKRVVSGALPVYETHLPTSQLECIAWWGRWSTRLLEG